MFIVAFTLGSNLPVENLIEGQRELNLCVELDWKKTKSSHPYIVILALGSF